MRFRRKLDYYLLDGLRHMDETHLRWSYLIIVGMVLAGAVINWLLPHGWTVWPFVAAAGLMMVVHEAAERNGEGIPPFHVYTWLISVLIVWMFAMLALSVLNPVVVLAGIGAVVYFVARGIVRDRERRRIVEFWRAEGRCTNCGEPADRGNEYCINCGEEPDPDATRLRRVAGIAQSLARTERLKEALKPEPPATVAGRKEQELLARRQAAVYRKPKS